MCVEYTENSRYFGQVKHKIENFFYHVTASSYSKKINLHLLESTLDEQKIMIAKEFAVNPVSEFETFTENDDIKKPMESKRLSLPPVLECGEFGGFTKNGFLITKMPPKAWSNVVSNGNIGFIATDNGGGFTFYENSREEKITDFIQDPFIDTASEGVLLGENEIVWSPARLNQNKGEYAVLTCPGKTEYYNSYNGITSTLKEGLTNLNKIYVLSLTNDTDQIRRIDVMFFARLVLGDFVENTRTKLRFFRDGNVLIAQNILSGLKTYLVSSEDVVSYGFNTEKIQDKKGSFVIANQFDISERNDGFCLKTTMTLPPKRSKKVYFTMGKSANVNFVSGENTMEEYADKCKNLSPFSIQTNTLIDKLLPFVSYQAYGCRFLARSGYYQIGGAYGFRDQLQDCLAITYFDPQLVRNHILYCAQRQFEDGDVLHWWHDPYFGVRTRISDNKLFLPYVVAKYIQITGDSQILYEKIPFLKNEEFNHVLCKSFQPTSYTETLQEHLVRAIKSVKFSPCGLPLIGDGDWNDAMNTAGRNGEGSSIWLAMFLSVVIDKIKNYLPNSDYYDFVQKGLKEAVDKCYNGNSYARLITDSGKMLGYQDDFIDLITQAFAVFSQICPAEKAERAMETAKSLVDSKNKIIKLLTPFEKGTEIGSIGNYPKGVRENGGQYTHGAIWYIMALYEIGQIDYAYELLEMILPTTHASENSALYKVEPYVICADVYSEKGAGEGGWSWYTGSASWFYLLIIEYLFGIKKRSNVITIKPNLPRKIRRASITVNFETVRFRIIVDNEGKGDWKISCSGVDYDTNSILLSEKNNNKDFVLKRK